MAIKMIFAVGEGGEFGLNDGLPWDIPEDLAHFKQYTRGCTVVMSGSTFESLPFRLPGRENVVISDREVFAKNGDTPSFTYPRNFGLKKVCDGREEDVCVIGGRRLLYEAVHFVDEASITIVDANHYTKATHFLSVRNRIYKILRDRGMRVIESIWLTDGASVDICRI